MEINRVEKLVPNLYNKKNYVIHIQALDQALSHGLILERIHRAIEFNHSAWMKSYIDFNTQLRTQATNDFLKDFFKLTLSRSGFKILAQTPGVESAPAPLLTPLPFI